jgi:transketolase
VTYDASALTDCRSAYGRALQDLARANRGRIAGLSCDLEDSVKMGGLHKAAPECFFECGIQEHHAATCAGALSREGVRTFFSTFGVFAVCETYNQHRLSDQNGTDLKVVCTHVGADVGEDGPTHQCVDYIALSRGLCGFKVFLPCDPNQADRITRYVARTPGNFLVAMGRSKVPVILDTGGRPVFGGDWLVEPGRATRLRQGDAAAVLAVGPTVHHAVRAADELREMGTPVSVYDFACITPLDVEAVLEAAATGLVVTVEDHLAPGGLGSLVAEAMAERGATARLVHLGLPGYPVSGTSPALYHAFGIDAAGILEALRRELRA